MLTFLFISRYFCLQVPKLDVNMTLVKPCLIVCILSLSAGNYVSKTDPQETAVQVSEYVTSSTTTFYEDPVECKWEKWQCNDKPFQGYPSFKYNCAEVAVGYVSCKDSCSNSSSIQCNNYCKGK